MKTKYIINNKEMILSLNFLYDLIDRPITLNNIRKYVNKVIKDNNINFYGNKIIVYKNGLLIGTFYLINYYLNKINFNRRNRCLTEENSYFYETTYTEMLPKKIQTKNIFSFE